MKALFAQMRERGIHEEELVRAFALAVLETFGGMRVMVKLAHDGMVEAGDVPFRFVYASHPIARAARSSFVLSQEAASRFGVSLVEAERARVELHRDPKAAFDGSSQIFDVPLLDGSRLFGVIRFETSMSIFPPRASAVDATDLSSNRSPAHVFESLIPWCFELASRMRSSRLLRESQYLRDSLVQMLEHVSSPIVLLDADRIVRGTNRAFLAATRLGRDEVMQHDFLEAVHEPDRENVEQVLSYALFGQPSNFMELRFGRRDGSFARLSLQMVPILGPSGELSIVAAMGRDVTEVRNLEEQIVQAEKLATLGQLAAGVVHELNNPLTSISVYSEYLLSKFRNQSADDKDVEKLSRIVESAGRMTRFTRDLVTYARPSREETAPVAVSEVLEQSIVFCEHVLRSCSVSVLRDYSEVPKIYARKGQLQQVFINLFTNAAHAMLEAKTLDPSTKGDSPTRPDQATSGRLMISVRVRGDWVLVRVADDGPGIAEQNLGRIFEPFFSTKGEGKGTGLGLSIVRNIVEQHRGSIAVESDTHESRSGTVFEISLPCARPPGSSHKNSGD